MSAALVELDGVARVHPARRGRPAVQALAGLSLRIGHGEFVAVVGRSGSGKSTLLHLLGLLDRPTAGCQRFDGVDVTALRPHQRAALRGRRIGFVFQDFHLLPRATTAENVALALRYGPPVGRRDTARRVEEALAQVGLGDRLAHRPSELSGGQQQRVAIARALVTDPALVLADEPTGNLDPDAACEVVAVLSGLAATGRTVVLVTHDPALAERTQRIMRLDAGRLVADTRSLRPGEAAPCT